MQASNYLRSVTVAGKLKIVIMATTFAALFVACGAAAAYDFVSLRSQMVRNLSILAELMGSNSTASLSFQDADVAAEVLRSLRAHSNVTRAATFTPDGKVFARYNRDMSKAETKADTSEIEAGEPGHQFSAGRLVLFEDIDLDGDKVGKVFIESDLAEIYAREWTYLGMASVIMAIALAVAYSMSSRLQRVITDPLLNLSHTAATVSRTKDYSLRAEQFDRKDEFGVLIGSFNEMLEQIQERDQALNQVNESLAVSEKKAHEATEAKSSFLANMSHELRTPLNSIIGFSEVLLGEIKQGDARADLEMIHAAGKHLLTLINGILDLSKIEAGKMELYIEPYDAGKLFQEVQRTTEPLVRQRGNKLTLRGHEEIGKVKLDVTKVRQCLLNLLSNANKFTEQGTVTLDVRRVKTDRREWLQMDVVDTGIGMTDEQVDKLFQPFTQADGSTSRKYGGTGLGLTISKRFCEIMGGSITLKSSPGVGTTFTMRIPYDPAELSENSLAQKGQTPVSDGARTVLIIDDDRQVHQLMQRFLTSEGWNVVTASSGPEGIRLAKQLRPAVITLDVMMSEMDGWSVLSKLRADPETAMSPVVMVSIIDDKRMGYALGASDYVTKPIDRDTLVNVLNRYRLGTESEPVLVIDDDASTRAVIHRMLEQEGWRVSEAENGAEAVQKMKQETPRLILLDLMMPQMNGFEFIDELRKHEEWRGIPVVVVSGHDLTTAEREQLNGCVKTVIQKNSFGYDVMLKELMGIVGHCPTPRALPSMETRSDTPKPAPAEKPTRSLKVLLADDNSFNQRLAVRVLKGMGHTIVVANDGREAVQAWEKEVFDLVLMDVQMPEMDGFEATTAIREKEEALGRHTPIIAMTAHAMLGYREKCLEAGMDDYIAKPIQLSELAAKIDLCISRETKPNPQAVSSDAAPSEFGDHEPDEVSVEELRAMARGDEEFMNELLGDFIKDTTKGMDALHEALASGDAATARRSVHSIKGLSRSVGAERLAELASKLEVWAEEGRLGEVKPFAAELTVRVKQVQDELRRATNVQPQ